MKKLGIINLNVAVQLDEPPFHLNIVKEMCNYRSVATKKTDLDQQKVNFEFSARFDKYFLH